MKKIMILLIALLLTACGENPQPNISNSYNTTNAWSNSTSSTSAVTTTDTDTTTTSASTNNTFYKYSTTRSQ